MLGSILRDILGISFTIVVVPVVKHFTKLPIEIAFTLNTLMIISVISVLVGVVFGTYPA